MFSGQAIGQKQGSQTTFFLNDHLGGLLATMSGAVGGAVHTIILRDAWGKQVHKAGTATIGTAYLYTGQRWDELLGLYDYNARWYDPGTGRFVSADTIVPEPARPNNSNRYTYVDNQPVANSDPSGHFALPGAIIGGLAGAAISYGSQVARNMANGHDLRSALTTNIDTGAIAGMALTGALIGATGGAAAAFVGGATTGIVAGSSLATVATVGAGIGGTSSALIHAIMSGGEATAAGVAGAFVSGAISGAVGTLATPIAGTLMKAAGGVATNAVLNAGSVAVNAAAGGMAYLAGGYTGNAIGRLTNNAPAFSPTAAGLLSSATLNAVGGAAAARAHPTPVNAQRTLRQAQYFMPRNPTTIIRAINGGNQFARRIMQGTATSALYSGLTEVSNIANGKEASNNPFNGTGGGGNGTHYIY